MGTNDPLYHDTGTVSLYNLNHFVFRLWKVINWKGIVPKSELKRIVRYLGHHTRVIHIQGGNWQYGRRHSQYCPVDLSKSRKREQRPKGRSTSRNGDSNLIEITDSMLRSIRLKCVNLESISFDSCKIDYYSR